MNRVGGISKWFLSLYNLMCLTMNIMWVIRRRAGFPPPLRQIARGAEPGCKEGNKPPGEFPLYTASAGANHNEKGGVW